MKPKQSCLAVISPGFPKDENDSTCLPAQQAFIRKLNEVFPNLKIVVFALDYPFTKSEYCWHDNIIFSYNNWKQNSTYKFSSHLSIWKRLSGLRKDYTLVGILSFWCAETAWIAKVFGRIKNTKQLIWINGQDAKKKNKWVKRIKPKANELIAISDFIQEEFTTNYNLKPDHVIPVGIDSSQYHSPISKRNIDVIGVGSLIPLKQYDVFIEIVAALKEKISQIRATICGKGAEEQNLLQLIDQLNLENSVRLAGEKTHSQVLELMQRSKIFLHPSSYEGFSSACLEALYAGAQVISFQKPMDNEIQNWHVVKTKEEMIGKAISILQQSDTNYNSVLPYSMRDAAQKIMALFDYKELDTD